VVGLPNQTNGIKTNGKATDNESHLTKHTVTISSIYIDKP